MVSRFPGAVWLALGILLAATLLAACGETHAAPVAPLPRATPLPSPVPSPTHAVKRPRHHRVKHHVIRRRHHHHRRARSGVKPRRTRHLHVSHLHFSGRPYRIGDLFGVGTYAATRFPGLAAPAMTRARQTGADWVREEFTANDLHLGTHRPYEWWRTDHTVRTERKLGFHILGLLDYNNTFDHKHTNGWMPSWNLKPYIHDYLLYVRAIVLHYRGQITAWQIWNEPDLHEFWAPKPNARAYAHLLTASYKLIKRLEPKAIVVMAGPSGADHHGVAYIKAVVRAGGRFDVAAIQPYRPVPDFGLLAEIRQIQKIHKRIWFTEMGWAGDTSCWSTCGLPDSQADRLARMYVVAALGHVRRVFWYDLRNDGDGPHFEGHFGLLEQDLAAKPAYVAYGVSHFFLNNATITGIDHVTHQIAVLRIRKAGHSYFVVWNNSYDDYGLTVPWKQATDTNVLDWEGNVIASGTGTEVGFMIPPRSVVYIAPASLRPATDWLGPVSLAGIRIKEPRLHWPHPLPKHAGSNRTKRKHHHKQPRHRKSHTPTPVSTKSPKHPSPTPSPTPTTAPAPTATPTPTPTPTPSPSPTPTLRPKPSTTPTALVEEPTVSPTP